VDLGEVVTPVKMPDTCWEWGQVILHDRLTGWGERGETKNPVLLLDVLSLLPALALFLIYICVDRVGLGLKRLCNIGNFFRRVPRPAGG
jgi:hypothetical protein